MMMSSYLESPSRVIRGFELLTECHHLGNRPLKEGRAITSINQAILHRQPSQSFVHEDDKFNDQPDVRRMSRV